MEYAPLQSASVAEYIKKPRKKGSGWTSFFRIFIVIVEIGASLIPGVGPEVALGIGLAAAAANTALSAKEGSLTGIGVAIDFGAAVLPFISAVKNAGRFNNAIKGIRAESEFMKGSEELLNKGGSQIFENGKVGIKSVAFKEENEISKLSAYERKLANKTNKASDRLNNYKAFNKELAERQKGILSNNSKRIVRRMSQGRLEQEEQAIIELESKISNYGKVTEEQLQKEFEKVALKYKTTSERIQKQMKELEKVFEEIKKVSFAAKSSRRMLFREIEKMTTEDVANIAKKVYSDVFDTTKTIARRNVARAAVGVRNREFGSILNTIGISIEGQQVIKDVKNTFTVGKSKLTKKAFNEIWSEFSKNISKSDLDKINKYGFKNFQQDLIHAATGNKDAALMTRIIKFTGSGQFNQRWVQMAQMIDPNDIGRAPIEFAYRYLKGKIENRLEQKVIKEAERKGIKNIQKWSKLSDAAISSGNILINSRYLYSVKRIKKGARGAALIVFNGQNTSSNSGKNVGGKRPIVAYCTGDEFVRLAEEGSSYYWAVGARKGWFISRGGHAKSGRGAFQNLSTRLSLFLAFVPIQSLRNVLSIVSNWVGNINAMAKNQYFNKFWPKLERALVRSTINRSARLVTKVVAGGAYSYRKGLQAIEGVQRTEGESSAIYNAAVAKARSMSATKSMWFGRELQRYTMSTLGLFEGADKKGFFSFKSGAGSGRSAGANLMRKTLMQSAPTAVRGSMMRSTSYYRGRTVDASGVINVKGFAGRDRAKDLITSKRNFQQVGRVYSAFTVPGVPTLRSLTRIK